MSTELFDYIQAIKPSLGDEKRSRIGLLLIHYITLARVSGGRVRIDHVLTTSGHSFTRKVLRNIAMVRDLAFALRVDTSCVFDDSPVPEGLRRLCNKYHIDVEACISRNKELKSARNEMWDLVIFVRVAQAVMGAMHEETLRRLDESYVGHRPAGYKPKSKWFGLGSSESFPAVRARDLPRAKAPRAVNTRTDSTPTPTPAPVHMARHKSDKSSGGSSSGSCGSKSGARKRPIIPSPLAPPVVCSARLYEFLPSPVLMAAPSQSAYFSQRATVAAYYHNM
ncbi:hypothetical protein OPQ81_001703 [Rhizoctonia solani]|nr:hypothetical protein OPQ81_001703 [Rhizoctonia solani]